MKKTVIFKENDQFTIKADFYETNRSQAPAIVYIHGGGLLWGDREDLPEEMIQLYTNNGFALFSIDYRLAPRSTLSDILEDVQDSLLWLVNEGPKEFSIDPSRIAVVGSSAGGFLALCTGMFTHKPRAIVSFYGYGDISAQAIFTLIQDSNPEFGNIISFDPHDSTSLFLLDGQKTLQRFPKK